MTDGEPAPFVVRAAPTLDLLDVRLTGLLAADDVAALIAAARAAQAQLACPPGRHRSLYDISACPLQSQLVLGLMRAAMQEAHVARRLAIVVGASLMRMQVRRIVEDYPGAEVFDTRQEAMLWLTRERMLSGAAQRHAAY